jgi:hypothetical protein
LRWYLAVGAKRQRSGKSLYIPDAIEVGPT